MIHYVVNEEKKTVKAILRSVNRKGQNITSTDALRKLYKIVGHKNFDFKTHPYLRMANSYSATVTCLEGDVFNEEKGKELARAKVKEKYFRALDKRLIYYYERQKREIGLIYDFFHRDVKE